MTAGSRGIGPGARTNGARYLGRPARSSLRITRVRDRFGRLHILRNGEVQNVINYSRGWTLAVVEFTVTMQWKRRAAERTRSASAAF